MRGIKKITVSVAAIALCMVAVPPASAAGSSSAATSHISSTLNVGDVQFDGNECVELPVSVSYSKTATTADDINGEVNLDLRQAGSNSSNTAYAYFGYSDPASGTEIEKISVCPYSYNLAAGGYTLTGSLKSEYYVNGSQQTANFAPVQVGVIQNPTTLGAIKFKKSSGSYYDISGTATASTVTRGTLGASGKITISIKKPGSKRWIAGTTTSADSFGQWSAYIGKQAKGTQVKVDLTECGWCSNATRTAKITK